jgi:hypothetical protein
MKEAPRARLNLNSKNQMNEENFSPESVSGQGKPPGAVQPPRQNQGDSPQEATGAAQSVANEAEKLKNVAREQGTAALEQVKAGAQSAAQQAQKAGRSYIAKQKDTLAQKMDEYAKAAHAAAERLQADDGNMLAEPTGRAAEQLERFSGYLREKDAMDLFDDLEALARRRPEVVFGGLFVAGLAAARFLKASRRRPRTQELSKPYRSSGPQSFPSSDNIRDDSSAREFSVVNAPGAGMDPEPFGDTSALSEKPATFNTP